MFNLVHGNTICRISSKQALDLEILLNKSEYSKIWQELGNVLFKWRLQPQYYCVVIPLEYQITHAQLAWVNQYI